MSKVFGIGLSRTGTRTLNIALSILGYKSVHYPSDSETFTRLMVGNFDIPQISCRDAVTDVQVARYFKQFDKQYPGSKFVLTVRDKVGWLISTRKHFSKPYISGKHVQAHYQKYLLRMAMFGTVGWNEELFSDAYDEHVVAVERYFKGREQDLLVMDICAGEGWNVLCPFLGKPIPEEKFPYKIVKIDKWKRSRGFET
jgi:hypothetical protein